LPKPRSKNHRHRHHGRRHGKASRPPRRPAPVEFNPRVHRKLRPVLATVGIPEAAPFVPDPFQVEAVELLTNSDVVVSAPTGSGKTWIAEQAIERALRSGQKAWYASPLKALSNAKFAEFGELFGPGQVGILTGDRKENIQAPLVVGTTEILRNQLYDAMFRGRDLDSALVVLDEAHFLGDPDRGVVWEEVIIYLPVRVRLLLLSATVENADQIARWLTYVRDRRCRVVFSDQRPVPLFPLFLAPDGEIMPLKDQRGNLFGRVRHILDHQSYRGRRGPLAHLPPFTRVLRALEMANLLPAIFFLKSRADCDAALGHSASARLQISQEEMQQADAIIDQCLQTHPFLADHPQLETLRKLHVAAHHAGHLPHWKLLVERLMQRGLLKAIFSTSTVAAGVNFPARSVVITQSDRFNGRDFVDLSATDLLQMTGRAGRRGMDKIGFCLVVPGPFQNVELIAGLLASSPEPIASQLHINFSMVLNLLLSHRPEEIKQLLSMSLATFQRMEESTRRGVSLGGPPKIAALAGKYLQEAACASVEEAVVRRRWRRRLEKRRQVLAERGRAGDQPGGYWGALGRGRAFLTRQGAPYAVLRRERSGPDFGVTAVSLIPERRLEKGRPRLEYIPLEEIAEICDQVLELPQAGGGKALARAVFRQLPLELKPLDPAALEALAQDQAERVRVRLAETEQELDHIPCRPCPCLAECRDPASPLNRSLQEAEAALARVRDQSHAFWFDFVRHLEFLTSGGYVDHQGRLTPDGLWASKLRLDQPVLIAEAIRAEALPTDDPVLLGALVALFVDDREREGEAPYLSPRLSRAMTRLLGVLGPTLGRLRDWDFHTPPLPPAAAAACFAWGMMAEFADTVTLYGGGEGDLAHLIYRTTDNLRQIISLGETHPRLAACAREAVDLLLRPPVVLPT